MAATLGRTSVGSISADRTPSDTTMHQRDLDDTSEALLESARRLLASEGAAALTVRRIASEVELSTMNVYSRFGGKDGIIDVLYREGFVKLFAMLAAVPRTPDLRTNIHSFTAAYRSFALENRHMYDLMFRSAAPEFTPSDESGEVGLSLLDGLVARAELAQSEGIMTSSIPPRDVALWIWASCHGMLSLEFDGVGAEVVDWSSTWTAAIDNIATILLAEPDRLPDAAV